MSTLQIQQLSKKFGQQYAVHDTTWQANLGDIVCLLGHSGCGKTTMLRLIAGLELPSAGYIKLGDRVLWSQNQHIAAEQRNIGLVFQDYALFPHLTVFDNIKFGLTHLNKQEQLQITQNALKHVSLAHHADKYPHMLSGGEQQRVALARALAPKPDVLLMDEPFSNLDRRLRDRIRQDTIQILRQLATTTVIVTHDPEEALQIADHIILMHEGNIIQAGTPKALYNTPNCLFSAEYFSTLNQIPCQLKNNMLHSHCGHFQFKVNDSAVSQIHLVQQDYLYCFRPYHVSLELEKNELYHVDATVMSQAYLGHQQSIQLKIKNTDYLIHAQIAFNEQLAIGQQVFIHIQTQQSFIYPNTSTTH